MAEIVWRPEALDQLDAVADHIEQFNPAAADRMRDRLHRLGESLRTSPGRGRVTADGMRQLVVIRPYVLTYHIDGDTVYIVRIRHSSRRPPE